MNKKTICKYYNQLSQNGKDIFEYLGTYIIKLKFQELSLQEKIIFINAVSEMDNFFDYKRQGLSQKIFQEFKEELNFLACSIVFEIDRAGGCYTISSRITSEPYLFKGKNTDGEDVLGVRIYADEAAAKKAILVTGKDKEDMYTEYIDDIFEFIDNGCRNKGYAYFIICDGINSIQIDSMYLDQSFGGNLCALLNRYTQDEKNLNKENIQKLQKTIASQLIQSNLFVPAVVNGTNAAFAAVENRTGDKRYPRLSLPVFTSTENFNYESKMGQVACVPLDILEIMQIASYGNLTPVINIYSARYIVNKQTEDLINEILSQTVAEYQEK